jgi:hypothetical protein
MTFCTKCGTQLAGGANFCGKCGTPVQAASDEESIELDDDDIVDKDDYDIVVNDKDEIMIVTYAREGKPSSPQAFRMANNEIVLKRTTDNLISFDSLPDETFKLFTKIDKILINEIDKDGNSIHTYDVPLCDEDDDGEDDDNDNDFGMSSSSSTPAYPPVSSLPPNFSGMAEEHIFGNGDIYKGEWYNGKPHGRGKKIFADGKVYEGDWVKDLPDGRGKMKLSNGNVYEGDWYKGRPNGKGKSTYANGKVEEGKWKNGEFKGKGLFG